MSPPPRESRLWLVRHAQPQVAPGTCYGALDVPADAPATLAAAQRLAAALPAQAQLRHSTLQRCEQLVLSVQALRPDLAVQPEPRLREMDFGDWEGRTWDSIGKHAIDAWTDSFATHAPGGGESLSAVLARVAGALQSARQLGAQDVVWITHAGVARCVHWLLGHAQGALPQSHEWPVQAPAWGEWEIVHLG